MNPISAATLRAWLQDGGELAVLDAREEGEFAAAHLFWAVPCPLSRRELRARALLPRPDVRVVCTDGGRDEAERLADWLESVGYTDVSLLEGGTPAWAASGGELFSGVNVPSKGFGEWVEHHYGTESIDAAELKALLDAKGKLVILDSRPFDEFKRMSIPGARNVPGGELAYRIGDLVPDPETLIVVNCAGRTRSILGAESLRRAGVPNRVVALRNGTMGWELAGLAVTRGAADRYPLGRPRTEALAKDRARAFAEASGVGVIGALDLARYEDDPRRTLYVFDVRDPDEYLASHRPGSISAPGGQLVQATDQWIGVRNARIALIDDDGVRARMTASWLRQMGHRDVFTVDGGLAEASPKARALVIPELRAKVPTISVADLAAALDSGTGTVVVDVALSREFRDGHIPGAQWGVRTRLAALAEALGFAPRVAITSPDGAVARLAYEEVELLTPGETFVLDGGTAAWRAFGRPLVRDRTSPPDAACIDVWLRPYDRNEGVAEAMRAYLSWEVGLVQQIAREPSVRFGVAAE